MEKMVLPTHGKLPLDNCSWSGTLITSGADNSGERRPNDNFPGVATCSGGGMVKKTRIVPDSMLLFLKHIELIHEFSEK